MKITPEQLHQWYLEAVKNLSTDDYNPKAEKLYEELSDGAKYIDIYIANKINEHIDIVLMAKGHSKTMEGLARK